MAKFEIEINSPDRKFLKYEIEKALIWLMNHDGIEIRGSFTVKETDSWIDLYFPKN